MLCNDADKLKEDLRKLFWERYPKDKQMKALAAQLNNYRRLKGTPFEAAINDYIVQRAEDDCEVLMHDQEMGEIWGVS